MDLNMRAIGEREVQLWDHSRASLGEFWRQGQLVLVFLGITVDRFAASRWRSCAAKKMPLTAWVLQWCLLGWAMSSRRRNSKNVSTSPSP